MSFPLAHSFHSFEHTEHSENDSLGWIIGDYQKFSPTLLAGMKSFSMGDEILLCEPKVINFTGPSARQIKYNPQSVCLRHAGELHAHRHGRPSGHEKLPGKLYISPG